PSPSVSTLYPTPHSFFLHSPTPHRPPHSFPTRRSSDLPARELAEGLAQHLGIDLVPAGVEQHADAVMDDQMLVRLHGEVAGVEIDRKSTRLNSSHDQISYAVFCLKKKNKQRIQKQDRRT